MNTAMPLVFPPNCLYPVSAVGDFGGGGTSPVCAFILTRTDDCCFIALKGEKTNQIKNPTQ